MNRNIFRPRRLTILLLFLATAAGLLGGCASPRDNQGGNSRIPNTSARPTATTTPVGSLFLHIATPSPVLLPTRSLDQPTEPPALYASPTGTATPQVDKVDPSCLVGTWQVADLSSAMSQSYAQSGTTIRLQGVDGQANYIFDPNGTMTISFNHLAAKFTGTVDNQDVSVLQGLDGSGTARYQVNPAEGQMVLSEFGGQGLLSTLDINGQRIAEGNIPVWQAFTSSLSSDQTTPNALVDYSRVSVDCQGDSMTIQAIEPVSGPPVRFIREK